MQIIVRDNNVDQALRALKKKLQREGVYREMKLRRHYEKPSEKRAREHAAAVSRARFDNGRARPGPTSCALPEWRLRHWPIDSRHRVSTRSRHPADVTVS
jgi:small subunit ribosomal protein S21